MMTIIIVSLQHPLSLLFDVKIFTTSVIKYIIHIELNSYNVRSLVLLQTHTPYITCVVFI